MPQAKSGTAAPTSAPADELAALCDALYNVINYARRANDGDPVEPALVRVLIVAQRIGPVRPSDLAADLRLDLSTVSRHVRALADGGLVDVAPDPSDKRAQQVTVTAAGDAVLATVLEHRRAAIGSVVERWPADERGALTTLLCRLADDMIARA